MNINLLRRIHSILFGLVFLFFSIRVIANDIATGVHTSDSEDEQTETYRPVDGNCPSVLKNWIDDDYTDQSFMLIPFKSEAKQCQSRVNSYQQVMKNMKKGVNFSDSNSLGKHLSEKFSSKVHSSYQDRYLKDCKELPVEKATAIQSRFYSASARIEATNSTIIDEVAYYDSILPGATLNGIDCLPSFPENEKKCKEYKIKSFSCEANKKKRFDDLVAKTKKNLLLIEELNQTYWNCVNKARSQPNALQGHGYSPAVQAQITASCVPFLTAAEIKKNETPWVRGESFKKTAISKGPSPRNGKFSTEYNFSEGNIEKALTEQLNMNRKALSDQYKTNTDDFRCLSVSSTRSDGESCDFKKIRTNMSRLPALNKGDFSYKDSKDKEAVQFLDVENECLLERGEDRAQAKEVVVDTGKAIGFTILTAGFGAAAAGGKALLAAGNGARTGATLGVRTVQTASKVARVLGPGAGVLGMGMTAVDLKNTYDSCSKETELVYKLSTKSEVTADNICSDQQSALTQAREKESDCVMSAILSAPGILPFAMAAPGIKNLLRVNKLNKFVKEMSGDLRAQDLKLAGSLSDKERILVTKGLLGTKALTPEQEKAIIKAHNIGSPRGFGEYTDADIAQKRAALREAGFSIKDTETLLWKGIAGNSPTNVAGEAKTLKYGDLVARAEAVPDKTSAEALRASYKAEEVARANSAGLTRQMSVNGANTTLTASDSVVISRIKSGFHVGVVDDIFDASVDISKKAANGSSRNGKSLTDLLNAEDDAMARNAASAAKDAGRATTSELQQAYDLEAWQNLRARTELARKRSRAIDEGLSKEDAAKIDDLIAKVDKDLSNFESKNSKKYEALRKEFERVRLAGGK